MPIVPIYRIHKNRNYSVISNVPLRDSELSLKARGLLALMLTMPDNYAFSIQKLCSFTKEHKNTVQAILSELQEAGYVEIEKYSPEKTKTGRYEYIYNVYEEKQDTENKVLKLSEQDTRNKVLNSVSNINTKEINTLLNTRGKRAARFVPPTVEEVKQYCEDRGNGIDAEHFVNWYSSKGWYVGRNKMMDWKAAVRTWEKSQKNKSPTQGSSGKEYTIDDL